MADPPPPPLSSTKPTYLEPSALGTKEYWDALYQTERANHAANPADTGTVWFDDSRAETKLVSFLRGAAARGALDRATTTFLDLGCGNGSLLRALRADGWAGRGVGVDYSAASVALAREVTEEEEEEGKGEENEGGRLEFMVWDILRDEPGALGQQQQQSPQSQQGWDVVLDKGTFDAVSLSDERDGAGRRVCEGYRERVLALLRPGGWFLVTSCNWTEAELQGWFSKREEQDEEEGRLEVVGKVEYPSFSFGGVKGQTISTLCLEKKNGKTA